MKFTFTYFKQILPSNEFCWTIVNFRFIHWVYKTGEWYRLLTSSGFLYFQGCSFCNCSLYNKTATTTVPPTNTTSPPYDIVNNPDGSVVNSSIDVSLPIAQTACGIQIYSGKILNSVKQVSFFLKFLVVFFINQYNILYSVNKRKRKRNGQSRETNWQH